MTSVVTIGTFDGVHRGHQLLLSNVASRAEELDVDAVVVTFEPIPISVLRPEVLSRASVDKKRTGSRIGFIAVAGPGEARVVPLELARLVEILAAPDRL